MAFPAEVENRVLPEFVVAQKTSGIRDFDLEFYDPLTVSEQEVERHVGSYMGEKLLAPRMESLRIGRDRQLDPNYLQLMSRAIAHARKNGNEEVAERYEKELGGMQGLVELVVESGLKQEPLPIVVMASDPGNIYVDQEGNKKSKTFVAMLVESEEKGWRYKIYDLPTKYIGLEKHWEILRKLGDISKTERLLRRVMLEITPSSVVEFPAILNELEYSLDELAVELGFESWDEVEKQADNQLVLEGDEQAEPRREFLIKEFTKRIVTAVREGATSEAMEALVNAMADIFAMEKGAVFTGKTGVQVLPEIEKMTKVALADKLGVFSQTKNWDYEATIYNLGLGQAELEGLWEQRAWAINIFQTNPMAREARATGCGGAGISLGGQGVQSWFEVSYQNSWDMSSEAANFGQLGNLDSVRTGEHDSTSTGKYKDYYDYKSGICAHCHEHKPYVAHPKKPDIKCAGWCSDCEY